MKCKKEVKCKEGSTTNLHNHLKRHRDIQVKLCPPKSAKLSSTSTENNRSPQQRTLLNTWEKWSRDSARHKSISQAVAQYIVQDMRPLYSVNDPGFMNLIRVLEPRYDLESRTHVTNKLIPLMYEETCKQVEQLLSRCEFITLTKDGWTSRSAKGFTTVTAHVIDESWQLKELVLSTAEMSESHTAENLSEHMRSVAAAWKIDLHRTVITTDNAANIVSVIERCDVIAHVRCMAHVLNLATQKGLTKVSSLSRLLGRIRSIVNFFDRSALASNALCKTLRQLEMPDLKPIIDVATRWNRQAILAQMGNSADDSLSPFIKDMKAYIFNDLQSRWAVIMNIYKSF